MKYKHKPLDLLNPTLVVYLSVRNKPTTVVISF